MDVPFTNNFSNPLKTVINTIYSFDALGKPQPKHPPSNRYKQHTHLSKTQ